MTSQPPASPAATVGQEPDFSTPLECPAYPPALRAMAVIITVGLAGLGLWSLPALRTVEWSASSLLTYGIAAALIVWVTWWMVVGRTRLQGDELTQTWLWDKRVHARDVTTFKLVHLQALAPIMAPRLMVRRRNGAISWFHASDAEVLKTFANRVVAHRMRPAPSSPDTPAS